MRTLLMAMICGALWLSGGCQSGGDLEACLAEQGRLTAQTEEAARAHEAGMAGQQSDYLKLMISMGDFQSRGDVEKAELNQRIDFLDTELTLAQNELGECQANLQSLSDQN